MDLASENFKRHVEMTTYEFASIMSSKLLTLCRLTKYSMDTADPVAVRCDVEEGPPIQVSNDWVHFVCSIHEETYS